MKQFHQRNKYLHDLFIHSSKFYFCTAISFIVFIIKEKKLTIFNRSKSLNMQTAIVMGGAGFLGSHLCDKLLGEGLSVICVDNLITGNMITLLIYQETKDFHLLNTILRTIFSYQERLITYFILLPSKSS